MKALTLSVVVAGMCSSLIVAAQAQAPAGQPPTSTKRIVPDLDAQVAYQRAFEAVLWAMPAVAIYHGEGVPVRARTARPSGSGFPTVHLEPTASEYPNGSELAQHLITSLT